MLAGQRPEEHPAFREGRKIKPRCPQQVTGTQNPSTAMGAAEKLGEARLCFEPELLNLNKLFPQFDKTPANLKLGAKPRARRDRHPSSHPADERWSRTVPRRSLPPAPPLPSPGAAARPDPAGSTKTAQTEPGGRLGAPLPAAAQPAAPDSVPPGFTPPDQPPEPVCLLRSGKLCVGTARRGQHPEDLLGTPAVGHSVTPAGLPEDGDGGEAGPDTAAEPAPCPRRGRYSRRRAGGRAAPGHGGGRCCGPRGRRCGSDPEPDRGAGKGSERGKGSDRRCHRPAPPRRSLRDAGGAAAAPSAGRGREARSSPGGRGGRERDGKADGNGKKSQGKGKGERERGKVNQERRGKGKEEGKEMKGGKKRGKRKGERKGKGKRERKRDMMNEGERVGK